MDLWLKRDAHSIDLSEVEESEEAVNHLAGAVLLRRILTT
jgi:hypothetical protein